MEKFEHLGFLIYFGEKGSEKTPLSQNAPFFANSDPDMPAAPVPASQVHDWISQNISDALDRISERAAAKENGQSSPSDQDVLMTDASPTKTSASTKGPSFIEGISKQSYVKQAPELKGSYVKVSFVLFCFVRCNNQVSVFWIKRFHFWLSKGQVISFRRPVSYRMSQHNLPFLNLIWDLRFYLIDYLYFCQ